MIARIRQIFATGALVALCPLAGAQAQGAADYTAETIPYRLTISGVDDSLKSLLEEISLLRQQSDRPPRSFGALRSRIDEDLEAFDRALRSEGYYDSRIIQRIDSGQTPVAIDFAVSPGPRYRIDRIVIDFTDAPPGEDVVGELRKSLPLSEGESLRAADILAAEDVLLARLPQLGYPLAQRRPRRVVIDHDSDSAQVTFRVLAGPLVHFGPVRYTGAPNVDRPYLERLRPWKDGEIYDQRLVDSFRRELMSTRLFGSIRIGFGESAETLRGQTGPVRPEIVYTLTETRLRTISVGAGFSTSEGFGGEVSWEHRNLFGSQERLTLTARGAEIEQSTIAEFRKPNFRRRDQILTLRSGFVRQDTDAFDSLEFNTAAGIERRLAKAWTASAATEFVFTDVEDAEGSRSFVLGALPLALGWDIRDDILNATRGAYVRASVTPHIAEQGGVFTFIKNELEGSAFRKLDKDADIVLAVRAALGSITGTERERLPANRRFFAGGGGSVRGFDFQEVGPLDDEGNPIGGRSLFEFALESRFRVNEHFGLVPFIEAGQVWEEKLPQFDKLRWGAGLGFRYFTGFAPIRLDIAFPINQRPTDKNIQFYISVGQSF